MVRCLASTDLLRLLLPRYLWDEPGLARAFDEEHADHIATALAGTRLGDVVGDRATWIPNARPQATIVELTEQMARWRSPIVLVEGEEGGILGVVTQPRTRTAPGRYREATAVNATETLRESVRWCARMVPGFAAFWLLLSGHPEPLFLMLGGVSVGLVCWSSWRADLTRVGVTTGFLLRLPRYLRWLAKEVLVSSVAVARRVWSPRPALLPTVDATSSAGLSELTKVVYANSITSKDWSSTSSAWTLQADR